jgi:hypothetical protein
LHARDSVVIVRIAVMLLVASSASDRSDRIKTRDTTARAPA